MVKNYYSLDREKLRRAKDLMFNDMCHTVYLLLLLQLLQLNMKHYDIWKNRSVPYLLATRIHQFWKITSIFRKLTDAKN